MSQDNAGKPTTKDQSSVGPLPNDQSPQESTLLNTLDDQSVADDLLHAACVLPPATIANVELTLHQLSETVDLFDVPPFDYGDAI
jgi:hypothetical protein